MDVIRLSQWNLKKRENATSRLAWNLCFGSCMDEVWNIPLMNWNFGPLNDRSDKFSSEGQVVVSDMIVARIRTEAQSWISQKRIYGSSNSCILD